jgi:hypothetical protein
MRALSGLFLQACFTSGMALAALFVVLLRSSLLHLVKLQGGKSILESAPYAGIGQKGTNQTPGFSSRHSGLVI